MNTAASAPAETSADRITIEIDWADWNGTLPSTSDIQVLSEAIEAELKGHIAAGAYPESTQFERYLGGGLQGRSPMHPVIEVSVPDLETLFDFYTAYCGGDSMQAIDELEMNYGYEAPAGWTPKR